MNSGPYNPLDKLNLGRSVAEALLSEPVRPLSDVSGLVGAGVYALYYVGNFPAYAPIAEANQNNLFGQPIYVGKAVPKGARKGGLSLDASTGRSLRDRLRNHSNSINDVSNLNLADFYCRALVVDDVWIPLGENMMIEQFRPIWNIVIDGFGNNTPGARRASQYRSQWDVLHRGRKSAAKQADGPTTPDLVVKRLENFFAGRPIAFVQPEDTTDAGSDEE